MILKLEMERGGSLRLPVPKVKAVLDFLEKILQAAINKPPVDTLHRYHRGEDDD